MENINQMPGHNGKLPMRLGPSRIGIVKVSKAFLLAESFALHTHQIGTQDITDRDDPVTSVHNAIHTAAILVMFVRVRVPPDHHAAQDLLVDIRITVRASSVKKESPVFH